MNTFARWEDTIGLEYDRVNTCGSDTMTNIDEIRYRILKALDANPNLTQRSLARELGISLGKANFCLNALITRGWVKVRNFHKSDNKRAYSYVLTPKGLEAKAIVAARFLKYKMDEYEAIRKVIEELKREAMQDSPSRQQS